MLSITLMSLNEKFCYPVKQKKSCNFFEFAGFINLFVHFEHFISVSKLLINNPYESKHNSLSSNFGLQ